MSHDSTRVSSSPSNSSRFAECAASTDRPRSMEIYRLSLISTMQPTSLHHDPSSTDSSLSSIDTIFGSLTYLKNDSIPETKIEEELIPIIDVLSKSCRNFLEQSLAQISIGCAVSVEVLKEIEQSIDIEPEMEPMPQNEVVDIEPNLEHDVNMYVREDDSIQIDGDVEVERPLSESHPIQQIQDLREPDNYIDDDSGTDNFSLDREVKSLSWFDDAEVVEKRQDDEDDDDSGTDNFSLDREIKSLSWFDDKSEPANISGQDDVSEENRRQVEEDQSSVSDASQVSELDFGPGVAEGYEGDQEHVDEDGGAKSFAEAFETSENGRESRRVDQFGDAKIAGAQCNNPIIVEYPKPTNEDGDAMIQPAPQILHLHAPAQIGRSVDTPDDEGFASRKRAYSRISSDSNVDSKNSNQGHSDNAVGTGNGIDSLN